MSDAPLTPEQIAELEKPKEGRVEGGRFGAGNKISAGSEIKRAAISRTLKLSQIGEELIEVTFDGVTKKMPQSEAVMRQVWLDARCPDPAVRKPALDFLGKHGFVPVEKLPEEATEGGSATVVMMVEGGANGLEEMKKWITQATAHLKPVEASSSVYPPLADGKSTNVTR